MKTEFAVAELARDACDMFDTPAEDTERCDSGRCDSGRFETAGRMQRGSEVLNSRENEAAKRRVRITVYTPPPAQPPATRAGHKFAQLQRELVLYGPTVNMPGMLAIRNATLRVYAVLIDMGFALNYVPLHPPADGEDEPHANDAFSIGIWHELKDSPAYLTLIDPHQSNPMLFVVERLRLAQLESFFCVYPFLTPSDHTTIAAIPEMLDIITQLLHDGVHLAVLRDLHMRRILGHYGGIEGLAHEVGSL